MTTHPSRTDLVVERLRGVPFHSLNEVSKAADVPLSTIRKIRTRESKDPRTSTVDKLYEYFERTMQASDQREEGNQNSTT